MKVALTIFGIHISPLFESAHHLLVVELEDSGGPTGEEFDIASLSLYQRVAFLKENHVELLVCGAIELSTYQLLSSHGIVVRPWFSGTVDQARHALLNALRLNNSKRLSTAHQATYYVAIPSQGETLDSPLGDCFGRSPYFMLFTSNDVSCSQPLVLLNPGSPHRTRSALQSAHFLIKQQVELVLTRHCGPIAFGVLNTAGIEVITGLVGSIAAIAEAYLHGTLGNRTAQTLQDTYFYNEFVKKRCHSGGPRRHRHKRRQR